jgi:hypothetical protein
MTRSWVQLLAILSFFPVSAMPVKFKMTESTDVYALVDELRRNPPKLSASRLPDGVKIGRCLLIVNGQTRITGPCSYHIGKGGDFKIDGPRQVFDGIDYPKTEIMASMISTDWWTMVFKVDGVWTGYSNEDIRSVHGQESRWGTLTRKGACFSNDGDKEALQRIRVCLWKK